MVKYHSFKQDSGGKIMKKIIVLLVSCLFLLVACGEKQEIIENSGEIINNEVENKELSDSEILTEYVSNLFGISGDEIKNNSFDIDNDGFEEYINVGFEYPSAIVSVYDVENEEVMSKSINTNKFNGRITF